LDFQTGFENGEPSYVSVLKFLNGGTKCDQDFTKLDLIFHDTRTRDFLVKRYQSVAEIAFNVGADLETRETPIGPLNSLVIAEQMKRTIRGDRFWFNHAPFFTDGKSNHEPFNFQLKLSNFRATSPHQKHRFQCRHLLDQQLQRNESSRVSIPVTGIGQHEAIVSINR